MAGPILNLDEIKSLKEKRKACICLGCSLCYKKAGKGCDQCEFPEIDNGKCIGNCYKNK